jgi:hypothetical protein
MRKSILLLLSALALTANAYDFQVGNLYYSVTDATELTCSVDNGEVEYSGEIVIPSTVTYKGKELKVTGIVWPTFVHSNITAIELSDNMSVIHESQFMDCSLLEKVVIPSSIIRIGGCAFSGCTSLKYVDFEDGTETLYCAVGPFENGAVKEKIYLGRNLQYETSYSPIMSTLGDVSSLTSVEIGPYVTTILPYFFCGASSLESITIPANVLNIKDYAFKNCSSLTKVVISDSASSIKMGVNEYNYEPSSIFIGSPVTDVYIGRDFEGYMYKFDGLYSRKDITFENLPISSVTIGSLVNELPSLNGCTSLESLEIPANVTSVLSFDRCTGLRKVTVNSTTPPSATAFAESTYVNGVLYVPTESIDQYSQTEPWSKFWEIKDLSAGVNNVSYDNNRSVSCYTLQGIRVNAIHKTTDLQSLAPGIYIVNGKKLLVK